MSDIRSCLDSSGLVQTENLSHILQWEVVPHILLQLPQIIDLPRHQIAAPSVRLLDVEESAAVFVWFLERIQLYACQIVALPLQVGLGTLVGAANHASILVIYDPIVDEVLDDAPHDVVV